MVVLVKGDLQRLVLTSDLGKLLSLEGCLSGNVPGGKIFTDAPAPGPAPTSPSSSRSTALLGAATFLNQSAIQASQDPQEQTKAVRRRLAPPRIKAAQRAERQGLDVAAQAAAAQAAATEVLNSFQQQLVNLGIEYGQTGLPRLDDPTFVSAVVFDPSAARASRRRASRSSGRAPTRR